MFQKIYKIFGDLESRLLATGPDLLAALGILIIGVAAAFLIKKVSFWLVKKIHGSKNGRLASWVNSGQLNAFATVLSRLMFWTTIVIFVVLSTEIFGVNVTGEWVKLLANYVPNVLASLIILIAGFMFANILKDFVRKTAIAAGLDNSKGISIVSYIVVCSIVVLVAIRQIGIDVGFLTSVILVVMTCILLSGAISFGLGSAPMVTNILSTFYLRKNLNVGHYIESQDYSGKVSAISATAVILQSAEGVQVIPSRKLYEAGFKIKHVSD